MNLADYFIAPDANGDLWIWREHGDYPVAVLGLRQLRDDPELWDYFTSDLPHRVEEKT